MYCSNCGTRCKELPVLPKYYTWEHRHLCLKCGLKFRTLVGDFMAGSKDQTYQVDTWGQEYEAFDKNSVKETT